MCQPGWCVPRPSGGNNANPSPALLASFVLLVPLVHKRKSFYKGLPWENERAWIPCPCQLGMVVENRVELMPGECPKGGSAGGIG